MSDQDCFGILDSEFDHYLVDMKPYVLKLTDKTGEIIYKYRERERVLCHFNTGFVRLQIRKFYLKTYLKFVKKLHLPIRAAAVCTVD